MAETTPALAPEPYADDQAPLVADRRPSSERKKSSLLGAQTELERRPSVDRTKSITTITPSAEGQSVAATEVVGEEASDAVPGSTSSAPGTAAVAGADAKSPGAGEELSAAVAAAGNETAVPSSDGATPVPAASAPALPLDAKLAGSEIANSPSTEEKKEEPVNLQWDYSIPLPNCYFRPSLMDLCVPLMAKNFAQYPGFGGIPTDERLRVVEEIPLDLPLKLGADMIPEEAYWKRRVQVRWRNCDIVAHGRSWKQTFFERNLQEALERSRSVLPISSGVKCLMANCAARSANEKLNLTSNHLCRYDATIEKEKELAELMKISAPYVHNLDLVQLPSHFDFKLMFYILQRELTGLCVNYGILETPGAKFDWSKWRMKVSDCRSLAAALTITATLTTLNLSGNRIDGEKKDGNTCKRLNGQSHSCGFGSLLQHTPGRSNHISSEGCRYLAEGEDVNRSLVSLNLTLNNFGDLGGKRILDWANNNSTIQRISLECCNIGEDSVQSYTRLMHNEHSALTALNLSGNRAIGMTGGVILLSGLEAGKQMKELWVANCDCGEEIETKILNFLVERKYGRTCIHHKWIQEQRPSLLVPAPIVEVEAKPSEEEEKEKAEKELEEKRKKEEEEEEDEKTEEEKAKAEEERKKKDEEEAAAAAAAAAKKKEEEDRLKAEEDLTLHVGHGHGEACTLECSRMVGLPSTKPPPEPVVYPETAFAARDAQAAIKKLEDSKPYWGLEAMKDMKEKETKEL
ncbi:hypothetical protein R1flu_019222 [Riccia fluitans]|uniref:Uncharacterized protein n=1 Tax=Riccia fluitans TaxID=41844 RepID=A0ABD1ZLW8_9MARC